MPGILLFCGRSLDELGFRLVAALRQRGSAFYGLRLISIVLPCRKGLYFAFELRQISIIAPIYLVGNPVVASQLHYHFTRPKLGIRCPVVRRTTSFWSLACLS